MEVLAVVHTVLFALVILSSAESPPDRLCHEVTRTLPADIILVVDRSNSISDRDFDTLTSALSSLISDGLSGTNTTRISIITYAQDTTLHISFDDLISAEDAVAVIQGIDRSSMRGEGMFTHTYDALKLAADELVPQARNDSNLFVILFTDGVSNHMADASGYTIQVANQMKAMRTMKVMAVGIGQNVNMDELIGVSSDGIRGSTVFWVDAYQKLHDLIDNYIINETVCAEKPNQPPTLETPPEEDGINILFVDSVPDKDFETVLNRLFGDSYRIVDVGVENSN